MGFLQTTLTKKTLESQILNIFNNSNSLKTNKYLDSIKLLGFYFSTIAGFSLHLEDLNIPAQKTNINLELLNLDKKLMYQLQSSQIDERTRFNTLISEWSTKTEQLKNIILNTYKLKNSLNPLYIMAFSGARGSMDQIRQLIGLRGLMADQTGNIIDLPILTNFKEGLTSSDYIISSYGARKGIVDTALKTADSGYLTRRLVYLTQDSNIKHLFCTSLKGIFYHINLKKNKNLLNLIGKTILGFYSLTTFKYYKLTKKINISNLNLNFKHGLFICHSVLTCDLPTGICQLCYGLDLNTKRFPALGLNIGIIAAQAIGEPGTQLTMRTFHTGGIFKGNFNDTIYILNSGYFHSKAQGYTWNNLAIKCNSENINTGVFIKKHSQLKRTKSVQRITNLDIKQITLKPKNIGQYSIIKNSLKQFKNLYYLNTNIISQNREHYLKIYGLNNIHLITSYIAPMEGFFMKTNKKYTLINQFIKKDLEFYTKQHTIQLMTRTNQYTTKGMILGYSSISHKTNLLNSFKYQKFNFKTKFVFFKDLNIHYTFNEFLYNSKLGTKITLPLNKIKLPNNLYLNKNINNLTSKSKNIGINLYAKQQNNDIVQGLPKIEELIEGRFLTNSSTLNNLEDTKLTTTLNLVYAIINNKEEVIHLNKKNIFLQNYQNRFKNINIFVNKNKYILKNIIINSDQICNNKVQFKKGLNTIYINPSNNIILKYSFNKYFFDCNLKQLYIPLTKKISLCLQQANHNYNADTRPILSTYFNIKTPIELYSYLFQLNKNFNNKLLNFEQTLLKIQILLSNSIQSIYQAQGVNILSTHIELVVKHMTFFGHITNNQFTDEILPLTLLKPLLNLNLKNKSILLPKILGATQTILIQNSFLTTSGFQETKRTLINASVYNTTDWLTNVKNSIISSKLSPSGTTFLNYKNYLDNICCFKN